MLPDITSQKVAVPAALFLALSPGVLVTTTGTNVKFMNRQTSQMAVFFHALVFFIVYSLVARFMGLVLTKTDLLVTTAMFIALAPYTDMAHAHAGRLPDAFPIVFTSAHSPPRTAQRP